jgi:hypothetical protein
MFIVLECYAGDDPRLVPEIEFLDQYRTWIFDVAYIKPEDVSKVPLSSMNYREVSEAVARAGKFANADINDRVSILKGSEIHQELLINSLTEHAYKPKVYYTLTADDKALLLEFYKTNIDLYIDYYYNQLPADVVEANARYKTDLKFEVAALDSLEAARVFMHTRCGTANSSQLADKLGLGHTTTRLTR